MNNSVSGGDDSLGHRLHSRLAKLAFVVLLIWSSAPVYAAGGILVFGDSLSAAHGMTRDEGWVALLRERVAASNRDVDVINASVGGETTAGGRSRLPPALAQYKPAIVILELGGNDGLRGLAADAMQSNLADMIETSREARAKVLLLGVRLPANYGKTYRARFHDVYARLAERYGLAYVPFLLAPIAMDRRQFQDDGIHPRAAAQPQLLKHIWPALRPLLADESVGAASSTNGR